MRQNFVSHMVFHLQWTAGFFWKTHLNIQSQYIQSQHMYSWYTITENKHVTIFLVDTWHASLSTRLQIHLLPLHQNSHGRVLRPSIANLGTSLQNVPWQKRKIYSKTGVHIWKWKTNFNVRGEQDLNTFDFLLHYTKLIPGCFWTIFNFQCSTFYIGVQRSDRSNREGYVSERNAYSFVGNCSDVR